MIGTSPGAIGTALAQQSLKGALSFSNSYLMNVVEAYIQFMPGLIDDNGEVTNPATAEFPKNYMEEFHASSAGYLPFCPAKPDAAPASAALAFVAI